MCDRRERERRGGASSGERARRKGRVKVSAAVGMLPKVRRDDGVRGDPPPAGHSRNITKVMLLDELPARRDLLKIL